MKSSVVAACYSVLFVFYRFTSPRLDNEQSLLFDKVRCTSKKKSVKKYKKDNNVSGLHRTQRTPSAPRCALTSIFFPDFFFFTRPMAFADVERLLIVWTSFHCVLYQFVYFWWLKKTERAKTNVATKSIKMAGWQNAKSKTTVPQVILRHPDWAQSVVYMFTWTARAAIHWLLRRSCK